MSLAIELLRIALESSANNRLSHTPLEQEWAEIYSFAEQQAIIGVLFYGIEKLQVGLNSSKGLNGSNGENSSNCSNQSQPLNSLNSLNSSNPQSLERQLPPMDLLMDWLGQVEYLRTQNDSLNASCKEWSDRFEKKGFKTCILKGQSNACQYPKGMTRTTGDVDILVTDPDAKDFYESRHNVIRFMRGIYPKCTVQYHHIELPYQADSISVEVHYTPVVAFGYFTNKRLQDYLWSHRSGCYPDAKGFNHFNREANLIFQMYHIFKHLIIEGVGLRQIIDYYWLLKSTPKEVRDSATARLKEFGLRHFAGALMYVLQECCGLDEEYLLVSTDVKRGKYFMSEILKGGNFGHHDDRFEKKAGSKIHNLFMLSRIAFRSFRYFPIESILSPLGRATSIYWLKRHGYYVEH